MNLLLDTCAILYFSLDPDRLDAATLDLICHPESEVWCSAISIAELACLQERGRISLSDHWKLWFRELLRVNGWEVVPVDQEIMEESWSLPDPIHRDPADRILIASARVRGMTLVTTDRLVRDYPHVNSVG